jgi:hypothetical protein
MGKKSTKKNKNIYQITREELELTRDQASELLEFISSERIEKIESEKSIPHPDEVVQMANCYKKPELCNYYCTQTCHIGKDTVPKIEMKDISQITLDVISSLNAMYKQKDRLIDIVVDGKITEDEYKDFKLIHEQLKSLQSTINTLQLWINKNILEGNIDKDFK